MCLLGAAVIAVRPPFGVVDQLVRATILVAMLAGVLIWRAGGANDCPEESEGTATRDARRADGFGQPCVALCVAPCCCAHRRREPLGLLFMDLDDFKLVNDSYGHRERRIDRRCG